MKRIISLFIFSVLPLTVDGITNFLQENNISEKRRTEFYISGHSAYYNETITCIKEKPPEILLVDDACLEKQELINFLNDICKYTARNGVIILTDSSDHRYIKKLVKSGIKNILHKKMKREEYAEAMHRIKEAGSYISEYISYTPAEANEQSEGSLSELIALRENKTKLLSQREREIIYHYRLRFSLTEIADNLNISVNTVGRHLENIKSKLGVKHTREILKVLEI